MIGNKNDKTSFLRLAESQDSKLLSIIYQLISNYQKNHLSKKIQSAVYLGRFLVYWLKVQVKILKMEQMNIKVHLLTCY